jgi:alpha-L-fucosidase
VWTIDVAAAGDYYVELVYRGEGRPTWAITTDDGVTLQNNQNSSAVYHAYPFGLLTFKRPGRHTFAVTLVDGDREKTSLVAAKLTPAE